MADQKQAIMKALKQAMGGAPMSSPRPKMRPAGLARGMDATPAEIAALERGNRIQMMEGRENEEILKGEKAISDADKIKMLEMMMRRMKKSPAGMMKGGKVMKYEDGGAVKKKKVKKPKMGCVMKGRGGKYKGQS
jgi:hypothetical protein